MTSADERYVLLSPKTLANPYQTYHDMRMRAPVYFSQTLNSWVITRYQDVATLLYAPHLSTQRLKVLAERLPESESETFQPLRQAFERWLPFQDPPNHTRLRAIATKAFPQRLVGTLRERITAIVDELLSAAAERRVIDVVSDLAYQLPVMVIAELLGVRREDIDRFKGWSDDIAQFTAAQRNIETLHRVQNGVIGLTSYFQTLLDEGPIPPNTVLDMLVKNRDEGKLDIDDVLALSALLLSAGHETTSNLIANGVLALLQHLDQWQLLCKKPQLVTSAVEEILRYDSPVQYLSRTTLVDISLELGTIPAGQHVLLGIGAANHDPEQFPDPDYFNIQRDNNRHLAFGYGIHFCLGAALARLEAQIFFTALAKRFPKLTLMSEDVEWHPLLALRALQSLPVRLR